jgi:hypothetical protein
VDGGGAIPLIDPNRLGSSAMQGQEKPMDLITTGIAGAKVISKMINAIRDAREAERILFRDNLSPGEIRQFAERFMSAAENFADAHSRLANAVTSIAGSAEEVTGLFGTALSWVHQGAAFLHRVLDLAEERNINITDLRKLLPPPTTLP